MDDEAPGIWVYVPGKDMAADYLSRHPETEENMQTEAVEHFVNMIMTHSVPKASTIKDIHPNSNR